MNGFLHLFTWLFGAFGGATVVVGLTLWRRTRDLNEAELTPALRTLREMLNARIHGNKRRLRIEGSYARTDVSIGVDAAPGGAKLTVGVTSPRGFWLRVLPRIHSRANHRGTVSSWIHATKALYADDEALASKLVADPSISRTLSRLTIDPRFSLVLRDGMLTATGEVHPDRISDQLVPDMIKNMARLVHKLDAAPEVKRRAAEEAKHARRRRNWLIAIGVGVCLVFATGFLYMQHRAHDPSKWLHPVAIEGWRPIRSTDLDNESSAVLQQHNQSVGALRGDFSGISAESGEAQVLRAEAANSDAQKYRVVVQTYPPTRFDRSYSSFAFALKVSNHNFHKIGWIGDKPPALSDRDAVLIVQQRSDTRSGELLLFDGKAVRVYRPEDYRMF